MHYIVNWYIFCFVQQLTREDKELKDPRGRTPLLLAITLTHVECVKALLDADCDVNCEKDGWTGNLLGFYFVNVVIHCKCQ